MLASRMHRSKQQCMLQRGHMGTHSHVVANYPNRKHYWVISHSSRPSDYTSESEHGKGYLGNLGFLSLSPLSSAGCALSCQLCAHDARLYILACPEVVFVWSVVFTQGNTINRWLSCYQLNCVKSLRIIIRLTLVSKMCLTKWRNKAFQGLSRATV